MKEKSPYILFLCSLPQTQSIEGFEISNSKILAMYMVFMMNRLRWLLFSIFCLFILWYTVFSRQPTNTHKFEYRLFWAYRDMFQGKPNWKNNVIQNIKNIVFFIPFGLLMPINQWKKVFMVSLFFSVIIETVQFFGGYGLCEVDDVICNTLGSIVGFCMITKINKKIKWMGI